MLQIDQRLAENIRRIYLMLIHVSLNTVRGRCTSDRYNVTTQLSVHYHIYDKDGAITSKTSFSPDDKSLGRIDTLSIAPPHTVASVKARIVKAEGVALAQKIQLFEDMMDDEVLMNDSTRISLFAQTYPGSVEHEPLAIVCGGADETGIENHQETAQSSQETRRRSKVSFLKRLTAPWSK